MENQFEKLLNILKPIFINLHLIQYNMFPKIKFLNVYIKILDL